MKIGEFVNAISDGAKEKRVESVNFIEFPFTFEDDKFVIYVNRGWDYAHRRWGSSAVPDDTVEEVETSVERDIILYLNGIKYENGKVKFALTEDDGETPNGFDSAEKFNDVVTFISGNGIDTDSEIVLVYEGQEKPLEAEGFEVFNTSYGYANAAFDLGTNAFELSEERMDEIADEESESYKDRENTRDDY